MSWDAGGPGWGRCLLCDFQENSYFMATGSVNPYAAWGRELEISITVTGYNWFFARVLLWIWNFYYCHFFLPYSDWIVTTQDTLWLHNWLTVMLLVANKMMQNKHWKMTEMNTNMTGFRWISNLCALVLWTKVTSALERLIYSWLEYFNLEFRLLSLFEGDLLLWTWISPFLQIFSKFIRYSQDIF